MAQFRLLALDLDGTTLLDDKTISKNNSFWINKAVQEGVIVMIATGRGAQSTKQIYADLGLKSPLVLLNGGEILLEPGKLIERHFLQNERISQLHRLAVETNSWFWGFTIEGIVRKPGWQDDFLSKQWLKFGIQNENTEMIKMIRERLNGFNDVEIASSAPDNMEFNAKGISKEYGVQKVCDLLGIHMNEVMAIGDSLNDMKLIQACGLGIAMGNAEDKLKQVADQITDTNENDGVAKAIQKYLLEKN